MVEENPIYEPREDSYLLKEVVESHAAGHVLEIGTGSGILSFSAANMASVKDVCAVDLNPKSIKYVKNQIDKLNAGERKKITVKKSNLFSAVKGQYDTIIFNPPYLPDDKNDKDMALYGGKNGYELIKKFLDDVNQYLTQPGIILLLFSSLTKKIKIDEMIEYNCFSSELISSKKIDFETLYVYKIEKSTLLRDLEMKGFYEIKKFDRGKRGHIFKGLYRGESVAIKAKNPTSEAYESINNEIKVLDYFRNIGFDFIPDVVCTGHNYFVYYFIEGDSMENFLLNSKKGNILVIIKKLFDICLAMDKEGYNKEEMHRPHKHIFISPDLKIKMIDFERAKETNKPKNITQLCQYLTSKEITTKLSKKRISIDSDKLRKLSSNYKKNYSYKEVESMKSLIK